MTNTRPKKKKKKAFENNKSDFFFSAYLVTDLISDVSGDLGNRPDR